MTLAVEQEERPSPRDSNKICLEMVHTVWKNNNPRRDHLLHSDKVQPINMVLYFTFIS